VLTTRTRSGSSKRGKTIWLNGAPINLNTILDGSGAGWTLEEAFAINSVGQILAIGVNGIGQSESVVLTPLAETPIPTALPLFAAGLAAIGLGLLRKKVPVLAAFDQFLV
jgi:hypothetical protein